MIWLIFNDFLQRRWWALGILFAASLLFPYGFFVFLFADQCIQIIFQLELKNKVFDVFVTFPVSRKSLGRAYWFVVLFITPSIVTIAYGCNLLAGGICFPVWILASPSLFFATLVLCIGALAGFLFGMTLQLGRFRQVFTWGLFYLEFGLMLRLYLLEISSKHDAFSPFDVYTSIGMILTCIFIIGSFSTAPRLAYAAVRFGTRPKESGSSSQKTDSPSFGPRRWGVIELWPWRFLIGLLIAVPLAGLAASLLKNKFESLDLLGCAVFSVQIVVLAIFSIIARSTFEWLEEIRALRILPIRSSQLALIIASVSVGNIFVLSAFVVAVTVAANICTPNTVLAGNLYLLMTFFTGCIIYMRWNKATAIAFILGPQVGAIFLFIYLKIAAIWENISAPSVNLVARPELQLSPWPALAVSVVAFALGVPYLSRLLQTRSYR